MSTHVSGAQPTVVYNRSQAVAYALRHWDDPNARFANMDTMGGGGDCANFLSQAFLAAGWPQDYRAPGWDREWWYRRRSRRPFDGDGRDWWSCTWALAHNQLHYMEANQGEVEDLRARPARARLLRLGDVIYYDWNGDGILTHSSIVTFRTRAGVPYVTYRTLAPLQPVRNRHWRLRFRGEAQGILGVRLTDRPQAHPATPDWGRLRPCDQARA